MTDTAINPARAIGRAIGRAIVHGEAKAANPGATKEELTALWKARSAEATKVGMRVLKALERKGYVITPPAGGDSED